MLRTTVTNVWKCYNYMCGARRRAGSGRTLLLFLVTCMHDAMQAMCILSAIWRTTDTVTCGTKNLKQCMIERSRRCERTGNSETLGDLELLV